MLTPGLVKCVWIVGRTRAGSPQRHWVLLIPGIVNVAEAGANFSLMF